MKHSFFELQSICGIKEDLSIEQRFLYKNGQLQKGSNVQEVFFQTLAGAGFETSTGFKLLNVKAFHWNGVSADLYSPIKVAQVCKRQLAIHDMGNVGMFMPFDAHSRLN